MIVFVNNKITKKLVTSVIKVYLKAVTSGNLIEQASKLYCMSRNTLKEFGAFCQYAQSDTVT